MVDQNRNQQSQGNQQKNTQSGQQSGQQSGNRQQSSGSQQGSQGQSKKSQAQSSERQQSGGNSGSQGGGKLDNVLYDVITVLHEKSKGLEAYEKYDRDLQGNEEVKQIFETIRRNDEEAIQQLRDCLEELISEGSESDEQAA